MLEGISRISEPARMQRHTVRKKINQYKKRRFKIKVSELISKLAEIERQNGDSEIKIKVGYFCGDYGGHNCEAKAEIEVIFFDEKTLLLSGWEI